MYKGFYFKELRVIGKDKEPAIIKLDNSLNVISGPSNTGKSYIFQCMDFMLGAQSKPKPIQESTGYEKMLLNLVTYEGKEYTIIRDLFDSKIEFIEGSVEEYGKIAPQELKAQKGSSREENISGFLLSLINLKGCQLKKNDSNEKKEISFRNLRKICLVNEEEVISESSPIYTGQYTEKTMETSLFKLLLSGRDDDELETIEPIKTFKIRVNSKIELLKEELSEKEKIIFNLDNRLKEIKVDSINLKIEELTSILNENQKELFIEEEKRQKIWKEIDVIRSKINQLDNLERKFILLDKHYDSDLKRLDFINEGGQLIDQLADKNCPLCDKIFGADVSKLDNAFMESIQKEADKILIKKKELSEVLINLKNEKEEVLKNHELIKVSFDEINTKIKNSIAPVKQINENQLKDFLKIKDQTIQLDLLKEEVAKINQDILYYQNKLQTRNVKGEERILEKEVYDTFVEDVKYFLNSWKLGVKEVLFDPNKNDIIINGDERRNHGKGYRAIYLAAFMLGLLRYCLKNDKPHPRFIVIDSPLTTYKEKDTIKPEDLKSETIQEDFFESISQFCIENNVQVIILDNKQPSKDSDKLNHIHFTGNNISGRIGFYPVIK
jgi:hypothetical protein